MTEFEERLVDVIPDLRRMARSLTRNRDTADDLVQATLERALLKQDLYQPTGQFVSWLYLMMRRLFVDQIRRHRLVEMVAQDDVRETVDAAKASNQYEARLCGEVHQLMGELTVDAQEVLTAVAIEGRSYEEAAVHFGIPMGTVRSRLFRAREALVAKMRDADDRQR
jgi:RNA polymerase sigma-70 factor (ECF subfamily)